MSTLSGKVAVISGGNSGIGLAIAQRFVKEGAHVFIFGRRQEALDEAVQLIGSNVTAIQADASKLADLDRVADAVRSAQGKVDIVVSNAGFTEPMPLHFLTKLLQNSVHLGMDSSSPKENTGRTALDLRFQYLCNLKLGLSPPQELPVHFRH